MSLSGYVPKKPVNDGQQQLELTVPVLDERELTKNPIPASWHSRQPQVSRQFGFDGVIKVEHLSRMCRVIPDNVQEYRSRCDPWRTELALVNNALTAKIQRHVAPIEKHAPIHDFNDSPNGHVTATFCIASENF